MSSRGQTTRTALNRYTFPIAIYVFARDRRVLEGEAHVVRNKKIEVAIAVVVQETAPGSPSDLIVPRLAVPRLTIPKSGGLGYVSKRSIAVVTIKTVLPKIRAKDIFKSVVVIVANANARRPAHGLQSGLFGHVGEGAVAVVLVEAIRGAGRISIQTRARQQKNIDPTVVVVIDEGAPTTSRLQNVFLGLDSAIYHRSVQSRSRRDIDEVRIEGTSRGRRSRHRLDGVR